MTLNLAIQDFYMVNFGKCEFPLEEVGGVSQKTLKAISIPQGSSVGTFDGGSGLIRVYHGREGWIDFSIAISSNRNGIRFCQLSSNKRPNGSCHPLRLRRKRTLMIHRQRIPSREPAGEKRPLAPAA